MVEAVREGYLLHYGEPRMLAGHDPDLALLAGDYLYALGLERLAALGDPEAVRELSDLISLCAQAMPRAAAEPGSGALAGGGGRGRLRRRRAGTRPPRARPPRLEPRRRRCCSAAAGAAAGRSRAWATLDDAAESIDFPIAETGVVADAADKQSEAASRAEPAPSPTRPATSRASR